MNKGDAGRLVIEIEAHGGIERAVASQHDTLGHYVVSVARKDGAHWFVDSWAEWGRIRKQQEVGV